MVLEFDHPKGGRIRSLGFPVKFSESEFCVREHPPLLGKHNQEVFSSLGLSPSEIKELQNEGVI